MPQRASKSTGHYFQSSEAKRRMARYEYLRWLNPSAWPSPGSDDLQRFGQNQIKHLVNHWDRFLREKHNWSDPLFGVLEEWHQIKSSPVTRHRLQKWQTKKNIILFWKPIIQQQEQWPRMHVILRCALALSLGSCDMGRLFSLLNRINKQDRRRLLMPTIEMLLLVAGDTQPWDEYDFAEVIAKYRKKRRVRKLRKPRADKGKKRKTGPNSYEEIINLDPDVSRGQDDSGVDSSRTDADQSSSSSEPASSDSSGSS